MSRILIVEMLALHPQMYVLRLKRNLLDNIPKLRIEGGILECLVSIFMRVDGQNLQRARILHPKKSESRQILIHVTQVHSE